MSTFAEQPGVPEFSSTTVLEKEPTSQAETMVSPPNDEKEPTSQADTVVSPLNDEKEPTSQADTVVSPPNDEKGASDTEKSNSSQEFWNSNNESIMPQMIADVELESVSSLENVGESFTRQDVQGDFKAAYFVEQSVENETCSTGSCNNENVSEIENMISVSGHLGKQLSGGNTLNGSSRVSSSSSDCPDHKAGCADLDTSVTAGNSNVEKMMSRSSLLIDNGLNELQTDLNTGMSVQDQPVGQDVSSSDDLPVKPARMRACQTGSQTATGANIGGPLEASSVEEPDWVDVLGSGKLMKKTLQKGKGPDTRPQPGSFVALRYGGKLSDETEVDVNLAHTFAVGEGDVIPALDLVAALMELDEISQIKADPSLAWGKAGRLPNIPPDSVMHYMVQLIDIQPAPDYHSLPIKERSEYGKTKRELGNFWYNRGDYTQAINSYTKALNMLNDENQNHQGQDVSDLQGLIDTRIKVYNNIAAANLKVGNFDSVIKATDAILKIQPDNVKALFRKGKALAGQGYIEDAVIVLKKTLIHNPEDKMLHNELAKLMNQRKSRAAQEKKMYQKMFQSDTPQESTKQESLWTGWLLGAGLAVVVGIGAFLVIKMQHS